MGKRLRKVDQHGFINQKIATYVPPVREGTPKGHDIGFSLEKYAASLWALFDIDLQELAIRLGCNYRTLLTWRSQPDFKAMVESHRQEFEFFLIKELKARLQMFREILDTDDPEIIAEIMEWLKRKLFISDVEQVRESMLNKSRLKGV